MVLDEGSVRLRPLARADADEWLAGEDDETARWFEFPRRSTRRDVLRAIEAWETSWRTDGAVRHWAICDGATIVGGVELRRLSRDEVNLSYVVFAPFRRRGFAITAAKLALSYAATAMGASTAVLKVLEANVASLTVARRLGAELVGRMPSDAGGTFLVHLIRLETSTTMSKKKP